jgi:hypothetical protein
MCGANGTDEYNLSFCLGVRSACLKTVTFAFNSQVGASSVVDSAAGNGRSGDEDKRMHRAASISAALSEQNGHQDRFKQPRRRKQHEMQSFRPRQEAGSEPPEQNAGSISTIVRLVSFNEAPAVNIDNLTALTVVTTQHVVSADSLSEALANLLRPGSLFLAQARNETEEVIDQ